MDSLESTLRSKILTIVEKLQKLECTLLGNRDDAWIMELLFKPGFHRYHLVEWMLSKLGYDIGKMSGPQNSAEERMKNLQSTLSGLGMCRENIYGVIKGTAEVKEQLEFWCQFTDIIWLKHQIAIDTSSRTDEGVALSPDKNKGIYDEFEDAASCINKLCESVNLNHLFRNELDLLPPDVLREIENLSPSKELCNILTLEEMQESIKDNPSINLKDLQKALSYDKNVSYDKNENDGILELNKLEERMSDLCSDLKTSAETSFSDVYNDLKPLIHHAKSDTFTDDGPAFQKLETPLDNILQLKNSFAKLESSYSKLLTINSNLEDILNQDSFSDENYVNILKLVKGELD